MPSSAPNKSCIQSMGIGKNLPLTDNANTGNDKARASYNNLLPQKTGPVQIIELKPQKDVIDEEGVPSKVSTHKVTAGPRRGG